MCCADKQPDGFHIHEAILPSIKYTLLLSNAYSPSNTFLHFNRDHNYCHHSHTHLHLLLTFTGLRRIGDLYKRHFEEATEEVRRLEVVVAETKEASARQISMLRDSLQTLGTVTSSLLYRVLPCPVLTYPILPNPLLPCHAMPCHAMPLPNYLC